MKLDWDATADREFHTSISDEFELTFDFWSVKLYRQYFACLSVTGIGFEDCELLVILVRFENPVEICN